MRDVNEENMNSEIVLGKNKALKLTDLIPYHEWPDFMVSES